MPPVNPGGSTGASWDRNRMLQNPDSGGIGGLFSDAADWISETADSIMEVWGNIRLFDAKTDYERARLRSRQQQVQPTSAPGGGGYSWGNPGMGGGGIPQWLIFGGLALLAVWGLPKLLK